MHTIRVSVVNVRCGGFRPFEPLVDSGCGCGYLADYVNCVFCYLIVVEVGFLFESNICN